MVASDVTRMWFVHIGFKHARSPLEKRETLQPHKKFCPESSASDDVRKSSTHERKEEISTSTVGLSAAAESPRDAQVHSAVRPTLTCCPRRSEHHHLSLLWLGFLYRHVHVLVVGAHVVGQPAHRHRVS